MSALWLAVLIGGGVVASYGVAARVVGDRSASVRLCATATIGLWASTMAFFALSPAHWFTRPVAVALAVVAALVTLGPPTRRAHIGAQARRDLAAVGGLRTVHPFALLLLVAAGLFVVVLIVPRGLVAPPLGHDDLTYHVFKAGSWVEAGGFRGLPGPDASGYYDYYPSGGEVTQAWFALPAHRDTFLVLAAVLPWAIALLAGFTASRRLGATRPTAIAAGVAIVSVPGAATFVESSYVDNHILAAYLLGVVFLLESRRSFGWWPAFLALASFGLAAGIKSNGIPLMMLGVVWLAVVLVRRGRGERAGGVGRSLSRLALIAVLAGAVAAPWYGRALLDHQSPLYPVDLEIAGIHLEGNPQLTSVLSGEIFDESAPPTTVRSLGQALVDAEASLRVSDFDLNWQPLPFVWVLLGAAGAALSLTRRTNRMATVFFGCVLVVNAYQMLAPEAYALRTMWAPVMGRLLLLAFASLVLLAATLPGRATWVVITLLAWAQLATSAQNVTDSWSTVDTDTLAEWARGALPALVVLIAAVALALALRTSHRGAAIGFVAVSVVAVLFVAGEPLDAARDDARDAYYGNTELGTVYRVHPILNNGCGWPLWAYGDDLPGTTIATAAGFSVERLHSNVRSPYLGSSLQHRVVYVPITSDGSLIDYADEGAAAAMDEQAWLDRLDAEGVAYLAVLPPDPPELSVIEAHPEWFELVARGDCDDHRLYRVVGAA